jgi:hypothetical protein
MALPLPEIAKVRLRGLSGGNFSVDIKKARGSAKSLERGMGIQHI